MIGKSKTASKSTFVCLAIACMALLVFAAPAAAQATYSYVGNPFTLFSCGPSSPGPGTILCSTPAPTNTLTSYTATDHVTATLVLADPLPANLPLQDVRTFAGFSLTMSDGQHTITDADQVGMFAEVATDANGDIIAWRLIINTGGVLNGGVSTQKSTFVSDGGTLACCDPTVPGDLASVFGSPGTWTSGNSTPTPSQAVTSLIGVVGDPLTGLTQGQINSLTDKLNNALASIQAGLNNQAINQLTAFINSVEASAKTGKINPVTADLLIDAALAIIASL